MSRIGKKPVDIPSGVKVTHDAASRTVGVEGPKGKMSFTYRPEVEVNWEEADNRIVCTIPEEHAEEGMVRALWGTTRSRIHGMVEGVTKGFEKKLEVMGVGWNAKLAGTKVQLNVGFCNTIEVDIPMGVDVKVENNIITINGYDKQAVGQLASQIRSKRKPEPYNGKGIKYTDEVIMRKQGKAFGA